MILVALDWPVLQTNSVAVQSVPAVKEATHQPCTRTQNPMHTAVHEDQYLVSLLAIERSAW